METTRPTYFKNGIYFWRCWDYQCVFLISLSVRHKQIFSLEEKQVWSSYNYKVFRAVWLVWKTSYLLHFSNSNNWYFCVTNGAILFPLTLYEVITNLAKEIFLFMLFCYILCYSAKMMFCSELCSYAVSCRCCCTCPQQILVEWANNFLHI